MISIERQAVSIHTRTGVPMFQYLPEKIGDGSWSRVTRDTSRCSLTLPPDDHLEKLELVPWLHWASVWDIEDAARPLWTGPIQSVTASRSALKIEARDCGAFMSRTRIPMSKKWESTDVALIAAEMWEQMIDLHGINAEPIIRLDPTGSVFDYTSVADTRLMSEAMDELVKMGLRWTVVSGVPILGPAPREPIAALGDEHFQGDGLALTRDGSSSYNDVMLLAGDEKADARVPMGGLNLQTIFTRDDLFGVSNAESAAYEAAKYYASIRDAVTLPGGSQLAPDAPLDLEQLIPSVRVNVEAYGQLYTMSLEQVDVPMGGSASVSVSMQVVTDDLPELATVNGVQVGSGSSGGVSA